MVYVWDFFLLFIQKWLYFENEMVVHLFNIFWKSGWRNFIQLCVCVCVNWWENVSITRLTLCIYNCPSSYIKTFRRHYLAIWWQQDKSSDSECHCLVTMSVSFLQSTEEWINASAKNNMVQLWKVRVLMSKLIQLFKNTWFPTIYKGMFLWS